MVGGWFVVVAPGVDMMFKAGSFQIRRLITVQVPRFGDWLLCRYHKAILRIANRTQFWTLGRESKIYLQDSKTNVFSNHLSIQPDKFDFSRGSTCQQLTIKNIRQLTGNNVQSRLTWDSAKRSYLIAYQKKLGLIADHAQLLTLARENKTCLQDVQNKHVFVK